MPTAKAARSAIVLDENQRAAIEHGQGPLLVVAGAGTGKTTVLSRRIAHLIQTNQARPDEILALTYSENAAGEMRDRIQAELKGTSVTGLQTLTFHAFCNGILHAHQKQFKLLDDKDLWIYLRRHIRDLQLKHFVRAANVAQFLDDLLDFMRRCHDELVGPERYAAYVERLQTGELQRPRVTKTKDAAVVSDEEVLARCREISHVFATVERMLVEKNLGTFSHMITRAYELLRDDPFVLAQQQARARFILVDEFQDANFAQVKILSMLAGQSRNVFAVGDPDQAIYRFRGASSAAFGLFHKSFPGSRQLVLGQNQRSTTPILQTAFAVVDENPPVFAPTSTNGVPGVAYRRVPLESAREQRALADAKPLSSPQVEIVQVPDRELEAADIVNSIREKRRRTRGYWRDFAVLYRSHWHRDEVAAELAANRIPFTIENLDVLDTPEVRDLLACLAIAHSTRDATSLVRVAALPQFEIDPHQFRAALRARSSQSDDTIAGLEAMLAALRGGAALLETLRTARREIAARKAKVADASLIAARNFCLNADHPAVRTLVGFASAWQDKPLTDTGEIGEFLDYLNYFRDARGTVALQSSAADAVRLMTAHAAKGLEFEHVYILRAYTGCFPLSYREVLVEFPPELRDPESVGEGDSKALQKQEERRLFYVAMTRARDSLTLYGKKNIGKKDETPYGILRELLKAPALRRWLIDREPRAFQPDLFAEAPLPIVGSRTSDWVTAPPASLLNRLSPTAIERYENCPLQFKLDREWKLPSDDPAAMQYGSVMHSILRAYFDAKLQGRPMDEAAVIDLFLAMLADAGLEDLYQRELYERQGIQQLRDFLADPPTSSVLHTEEPFEMRLGSATLAGRIDRIDDLGSGAVAIIDYKTGKPRSQEDADESLQLSVYAMAAESKWGYRAQELVLYNLDGNTPVISHRSAAQLNDARLRVDEVMAKVEKGLFDPKPGNNCRFCAYQKLCPATEKPLPIVLQEEN